MNTSGEWTSLVSQAAGDVVAPAIVAAFVIGVTGWILTLLFPENADEIVRLFVSLIVAVFLLLLAGRFFQLLLGV